MYSIVILDDERNICNLISNLLDYDTLGVTLERAFTDSTACLDYISAHRTDIVISDIQMNDMTGLELLEEARSRGLTSHFIMVSGFNYFDFAKRAIEYGADNYLLKPISQKELNSAVAAAIQKINKENANVYEMAAAKEALKLRSADLFSSCFFTATKATCSLSPEQIAGKYGNLFDKPLFRVGLLHIDVIITKYYKDSLLLENITEKLRSSLKNVQIGLVAYISNSRNMYLLFNYEKEQEDALLTRLRNSMSRLSQLYGGNEDVVFTLGVSSACFWGEELEEALLHAQRLVKNRFFYHSSGTIIADHAAPDIPESENARRLHAAELKKQLTALAEVMNADGFKAVCLAAFEQECADRTAGKDSADYIVTLADTACGCIRDCFGSAVDVPDSMCLDGINGNFRTLEEYKASFVKYIDALSCAITLDAEKSDKWAIAKVKSYVNDHYNEKISITRLADEVCLSTAYLGTLFSNVTGMTILEYLTDFRLKESKELLVNSSKNIAEIAYSVGFNDAKYYTKVFKKAVGVSPKRYREIQLTLDGRR